MKKTNAINARMKWLFIAALCLVFALGSAACSSKANNDAGPSDQGSDTTTPAPASASAATPDEAPKLDPVELIWYYPQPKAQPDLQLINDELNKLTQAKINATIKLQPVDYGNYEQKLNTMVAANDEIDIIWTSSWLFKWVDNQKKGVFLPLDELLQNQGAQLYASLDEKFWNDAKIDGKIYAVPSYQISAKKPGLVIQKRFADKYNLDVGSIKKMADIEPFLQQVKDGEPGIVPFGIDQHGFWDPALNGLDPSLAGSNIGMYKNDSNHQVINTIETPEYKQYLDLARSWNLKGYVNKDAATLKSYVEAYKDGKAAVWYDYTGKPGSEVEFKTAAGGNDVILVPLTEATFTGASSTMNAISRTSKNPERAMMFLQLVNTDKEIYNLLTYGIEGKHYTKTEGNYIQLTPDSGYAPGTDWVFGNIRNEYLPEGAPADKLELTQKANDEAFVSPYYGFVFNTEPVKTEIANTSAIYDEYGPGLLTGTVDTDKYLPTFITKDKQAGRDKIIAEMQKQLDEWSQTNGK